ncbi:MAG: ABC transporter permease, partial [Candidatus Syntrophonatronum acetioxidans]
MFEFQVALRFLKEGRMQTLLIMVGIAIGIAVLIFLNALIGGLQADLLNSTVGSSPHIVGSALEKRPPSQRGEGNRVLTREAIRGDQERPLRNWTPLVEQLGEMEIFEAVTPVIDGSGFITLGEASLPVLVRGFPLHKGDDIYSIQERMVEGEFAAEGDRVLIGKGLAEELGVSPGNIIRLRTPEEIDRTFTVAGTFDLGVQAINDSWVVLSLEKGQTLYNLEGGISGIELQVGDVFAADGTARSLEQTFPDLEWVSWQEENADLLSALSSQSSSSYVIQAFILLAVTMGISSVLAVSAIQKSRQIGILKALGITTSRVSRIFLIQGALLGFTGSLLGSALGTSLVWSFFYFVRTETGEPLFPVNISPGIFLFAVVIATLAG